MATDATRGAIITADGSPTLVHPTYCEAYSSVHGAWSQARYLYLEGTQTHLHPAPKVLEVGFGLGFNFRVTLQDAISRGVYLHYLAYESEPVSRQTLMDLDWPLPLAAQAVWQELLDQWSASSGVFQGPWGCLDLRCEDVTQTQFPLNFATAVYFDPFSPQTNPLPWALPVIQRLKQACLPDARVATYSVAGEVRRRFSQAGFAVQKVRGQGKKQWLWAQNA